MSLSEPGRVDRHREAAVGPPDGVELHALGFLCREDGLTAEHEVDGPRIDLGDEGRGNRLRLSVAHLKPASYCSMSWTRSLPLANAAWLSR